MYCMGTFLFFVLVSPLFFKFEVPNKKKKRVFYMLRKRHEKCVFVLLNFLLFLMPFVTAQLFIFSSALFTSVVLAS